MDLQVYKDKYQEQSKPVYYDWGVSLNDPILLSNVVQNECVTYFVKDKDELEKMIDNAYKRTGKKRD